MQKLNQKIQFLIVMTITIFNALYFRHIFNEVRSLSDDAHINMQVFFNIIFPSIILYLIMSRGICFILPTLKPGLKLKSYEGKGLRYCLAAGLGIWFILALLIDLVMIRLAGSGPLVEEMLFGLIFAFLLGIVFGLKLEFSKAEDRKSLAQPLSLA